MATLLPTSVYLKRKAIEVINERIERSIVPLGTLAPLDHAMKTFSGSEVKLGDYVAKNHTLLVFMRASWCPYCRGYFEILNGMSEYFQSLGCEIVVLSREPAEESTFKSDRINLITDETNALGRKFNMCYYATEEITKIYKELNIPDQRPEGYWDESELNVPATLILKKETGQIMYKHAKRDYTQRATGSEILIELQALNQKIWTP